MSPLEQLVTEDDVLARTTAEYLALLDQVRERVGGEKSSDRAISFMERFLEYARELVQAGKPFRFTHEWFHACSKEWSAAPEQEAPIKLPLPPFARSFDAETEERLLEIELGNHLINAVGQLDEIDRLAFAQTVTRAAARSSMDGSKRRVNSSQPFRRRLEEILRDRGVDDETAELYLEILKVE